MEVAPGAQGAFKGSCWSLTASVPIRPNHCSPTNREGCLNGREADGAFQDLIPIGYWQLEKRLWGKVAKRMKGTWGLGNCSRIPFPPFPFIL